MAAIASGSGGPAWRRRARRPRPASVGCSAARGNEFYPASDPPGVGASVRGRGEADDRATERGGGGGEEDEEDDESDDEMGDQEI